MGVKNRLKEAEHVIESIADANDVPSHARLGDGRVRSFPAMVLGDESNTEGTVPFAALFSRTLLPATHTLMPVLLTALAEIPGMIIAVLIVDKPNLGRRGSVILFMAISAVLSLWTATVAHSGGNWYIFGNMLLRTTLN